MANSKEWSRRDFLKVAGGSALAVGLLYVSLPQLQGEKGAAKAATSGATTEWPVIWLQTGTCTGCSVSVLNSLSPRIQNVLVDEVVPDNHVSLRYHMTVMAAAGDLAIQAMKDTAQNNKNGYVLVVEGSIATKDDGVYDQFGMQDGNEVSALTWTQDLGRDALAVIALGTCAVGGGIPAASPNPTGCVTVQKVFADANIATPVINVPGCPPHPDWFVGTVATVLLNGSKGLDAVVTALELDDQGRPGAFFRELVHHNCPRYSYFERGQFSTQFGQEFCMYQIGCKGPITHADCPKRLWNSGTNWCVGANSLCHGCAEPAFPDFKDLPERYHSIRRAPESWEVVPLKEQTKQGMRPAVAGVVGAVVGAAVAAAVVGGGAYVVTKAKAKRAEGAKEEKKVEEKKEQ